ncbi:MAG: OadG family protein [Butyrivibrio sp.]|nr:OadG family protein [Acetatifactor muris]MCM1560481.1 OadG family protein [Butyrivibrio sp.]
MKKKLLAYVCMIACVFGLTACGEGEGLTANEQGRVNSAGEASAAVVSLFSNYLCNDIPFAVEDMETNEEIEYLCEQYFGIMADGNAVVTGVQSFDSALKTIGSITGTGEAEVKIDGKQIIVELPVTGEKQNAVAEIVFSNDLFMRLESAALNPTASMGQLMAKAAMNTLIGMLTVFGVLILISFIISCFRFISKAQDAAAKKKAAKTADNGEGADNAAAQPADQETSADETDDAELVAVIAAAIAASEGAASADGFVVRSVIRR